MKYVSFKNKEIYKNIKGKCSIHRLMYKTETHIAVELEILDDNSCWHINCPFEDEFKKQEELAKNNNEKAKEFMDFWGKYRKWQKRKVYTIDEFNEQFEPLE